MSALRPLALLVVVAAACMGADTGHAQGTEALRKKIATREIVTYPFVATPRRAATIREGFPRVRTGMSPAEVMALLGEPDEIRPLYAPQMKNGKVIGYTHWYVIRRLTKHGSVDEKGEALVRVSFGLDDRVSGIDDWGL
jgi:hypothetical protein